FRPRGDGRAPLVEVTCRDGAADRCPSGGTLVFRVDGAAEGGYLLAWAEPAGGGSRIWYFSAGARSLKAQAGPPIVPTGIKAGHEQPPGVSDIHPRAVDRPASGDLDAPIIRRITVTP